MSKLAPRAYASDAARSLEEILSCRLEAHMNEDVYRSSSEKIARRHGLKLVAHPDASLGLAVLARPTLPVLGVQSIGAGLHTLGEKLHRPLHAVVYNATAEHAPMPARESPKGT